MDTHECKLESKGFCSPCELIREDAILEKKALAWRQKILRDAAYKTFDNGLLSVTDYVEICFKNNQLIF